MLSHHTLFNFFNQLAGITKSRQLLAERHIRAKPGQRILDIGCGTADILGHLPAVEYRGFDQNASYIQAAQRRFGPRGTFLCKDLRTEPVDSAAYDRVLALGVLHHLNDEECLNLLRLAKAALKPGGHFVTIDGCFIPNQNKIARWLMQKDRGHSVRTQAGYADLISKVFSHAKVFLYNDLVRFPYDHIVFECEAK